MAEHEIGPGGGFGPVRVRTFARLKLRVLANGLRGQTWRVVLFVGGAVAGLYFGVIGFLVFLVSGLDNRPDFVVLVPVLGGATLVLGWFFVPLVWTGVDESLDPARFALLPLPRRTLVAGLLVAAVLGIPAVVTLLATSGLVAGAAIRGGPAAAGVELVGIVLGLLLCVTLSRATTSAFASLLRSRRTRDLAAIVLALLAALLGPLQLGVARAIQGAGLAQLLPIAEALGWTPLGAPYVAGFDVAAGRPGAAAVRLLVTAAALVLLLRWWSRALESAMVGTASRRPGSGAREGAGGPAAVFSGGAVTGLYPRGLGWLPRDQFGALVVREARYWWRDPRRRSSLIMIAILGVFIPALLTLGDSGFGAGAGAEPGSGPAGDAGFGAGPGFGLGVGQSGDAPPGMAALSMLMVGALAALSLANQFGFDGTAYAAHLVVGIRGRTEMGARAAGFSLVMAPLLVVIPTVLVLVLGDPAALPALLGGLAAAYGTGLAVNQLISVYAAYALPESTNPFVINTGAGLAKSLLAIVALLGGLVLATPVAVAAVLLPPAWSGLLLPVGVGYGLAAAMLGSHIAGDVVDRRAPELLAAVTPRR
jgi:ABC-2 type transport system permease protein